MSRLFLSPGRLGCCIDNPRPASIEVQQRRRRESSGNVMTRLRILLIAVLALTLQGCANPRPTLFDDPNSGLRCLEFALSGCIRYNR